MSRANLVVGALIGALNVGWAFVAVFNDCQVLGVINAVCGGVSLGIVWWESDAV